MTAPNLPKVPIIDLGLEYRALKSEIDQAISSVLSSGQYVMGEWNRRFEKTLAEACECSHAIAVNSGTDALLLAYRVLGIGPGDEVIVPSMTFFATVEAVVLLGAKPVFADIRMDSYTLDAEDVARKITPKTKAIVPVHLYGQAADMADLVALSTKHKIYIVEDMAQAIGAHYQGKSVGTFGRVSALSFFPTKNLGAAGDAGAILTNDPKLDQHLRSLRSHGATVKYVHEEVGYNTRMDELQAAILSVKFQYLKRWNQMRASHAAIYDERLKETPVVRPAVLPDRDHVYHLYTLRAPCRDQLRQFLEERGIGFGMHYAMPVHLQKAMTPYGCKAGDLPNTEAFAAETLSLPLYPMMAESTVHLVADAVAEFYKSRG